jgi:hypothetical protein
MSNPNEPQIKEIKCSNELLNHHHHPSKYRKENIKNCALIPLNLYLLLIHEKLFFVLNYTKNENNAQPRHVHELRRTLFGHR